MYVKLLLFLLRQFVLRYESGRDMNDFNQTISNFLGNIVCIDIRIITFQILCKQPPRCFTVAIDAVNCVLRGESIDDNLREFLWKSTLRITMQRLVFSLLRGIF